MRPANPQLTRDSARLAVGLRSNSSNPKLRIADSPGRSLPKSFTRLSVNLVTPLRSSSRHAAKRASSAVKSGSSVADASISASVAASRSPRLKPWPATGCSACAALPINATRPVTVSLARDNASGYVCRFPMRVHRPARHPKASCSLAANCGSSSASSSCARSGFTAQMTAYPPLLTGNTASGPVGVNRSKASPVFGRSVAALSTMATWS